MNGFISYSHAGRGSEYIVTWQAMGRCFLAWGTDFIPFRLLEPGNEILLTCISLATFQGKYLCPSKSCFAFILEPSDTVWQAIAGDEIPFKLYAYCHVPEIFHPRMRQCVLCCVLSNS